ncbi:ATP-binding protein [Geodermatophilus sp. SYSU D00700]
MGLTRPPGFLDRASECDELDRVLVDLRSGSSVAVVIRGEAGIGKTTLLRYAARRAAGIRLAHVTGVEVEMELPFAGVHQLCARMLHRLDALPNPQRDALSIALGLSAGEPPERFLVGLAVLSLLSAVAEEQPLLCLVEDAQWLDAASAQVIGFASRRVLAESVAIVVAIREPATRPEFDGLPELRLGGLPTDDARVLLATAVPGRLDTKVRERIISQTGGNPLALLELPRRMTAAELAGGFDLPASGGLSAHIEDHYRRRVGELPEATQRLMLLAAADPSGDATLLWRAAPRLGIDTSALAPAAEAQLLQIGAEVRFRHPLVRSAVYRGASREDRQRVHRVLADVTDAESEADRRAWHRGQAASGHDEDVAAELERSAGRAHARGGFAAAATLLQRAVTLTGDPARRAERALAAARASLGAGAFDVVQGLLAAAEAGPLDEMGRGRLERLRADLAYRQETSGEAPRMLLQAAKRLETLDVRLARDTYLDAWSAALYAGGLASAGGGLHDVSLAAINAPHPTDTPRPRDLLLDGLALLFTDGRLAAAPILRRAIGAFASSEVSGEELARWGWIASRAANVVWDYDACLEISTRAVQLARDSGALEVLAMSDNACGQAAAMGGDLPTAALVASELDAVREATGTHLPPIAALARAGIHGEEVEASRLISDTIVEATARGQGVAAQYARWASAVLLNGLGRYDGALVAALEASEETPEMPLAMWSQIELIEAASRTKKIKLAVKALARLETQTVGSDTDWAHGVLARSRALISEGRAAEDLYREAIARLERTRLRPDLARARLLFGEWLRREKRRIDARGQLLEAHDQFTSMDMRAFAQRARGELLASGGKARRRTLETRDDLTAQERHIAQLASAGCRTRRSVRGCSSAPARWSGTCGRYSSSSESGRAAS